MFMVKVRALPLIHNRNMTYKSHSVTSPSTVYRGNKLNEDYDWHDDDYCRVGNGVSEIRTQNSPVGVFLKRHPFLIVWCQAVQFRCLITFSYEVQ